MDTPTMETPPDGSAGSGAVPPRPQAETMRALWPLFVTSAVVVALLLAAQMLESRAPDTFEELGGWVTSLVLALVVSGTGSMVFMLRIRKSARVRNTPPGMLP
jgi:drug/metabolite transporter (DMT)-like permease